MEEVQPQTAPEKSKTQKALRSLNDVLGKAMPPAKETKSIPGSSSHSMQHLLFNILLYLEIYFKGGVSIFF